MCAINSHNIGPPRAPFFGKSAQSESALGGELPYVHNLSSGEKGRKIYIDCMPRIELAPHICCPFSSLPSFPILQMEKKKKRPRRGL